MITKQTLNNELNRRLDSFYKFALENNFCCKVAQKYNPFMKVQDTSTPENNRYALCRLIGAFQSHCYMITNEDEAKEMIEESMHHETCIMQVLFALDGDNDALNSIDIAF